MVPQMVLMLQGEKTLVAVCSEGFMMNCAAASHVVAESGQHTPSVAGHVWDVQSWIAPKPCPISWETTIHSLGVIEETPVPAVYWSVPCAVCDCVFVWQRAFVHAIPTIGPELHFVIKCHSPAPSLLRSPWPLQ